MDILGNQRAFLERAGTVLVAPTVGAVSTAIGNKVLPSLSQTSSSNAALAANIISYTAVDVYLMTYAMTRFNDPVIQSMIPVLLLSTQPNYVLALNQFFTKLGIVQSLPQ